MDQDPGVYFKKILQTISTSILWMITAVFAGMYIGLGDHSRFGPTAAAIFYTVAGITFIMLIRYIFRLWRK